MNIKYIHHTLVSCLSKKGHVCECVRQRMLIQKKTTIKYKYINYFQLEMENTSHLMSFLITRFLLIPSKTV